MPLDQIQKLTDLVRLGLAANILNVDEFGNAWALENVMAAADPDQGEAECLDQRLEFRKPDVVRSGNQLLQQLSFVQDSFLSIGAAARPAIRINDQTSPGKTV
jgi:hypothetical protein